MRSGMQRKRTRQGKDGRMEERGKKDAGKLGTGREKQIPGSSLCISEISGDWSSAQVNNANLWLYKILMTSAESSEDPLSLIIFDL